MPPSLTSLTAFMHASTGTTRRLPSRLCSLQTTSPQGRTGGKKWPGSYCQTGPLNKRRAAHSKHCTYRPVSGLLGKIPIHLTLLQMITKKLHHICFFYNIWIHQFAWMDTWNEMILATVTLQGRYSLLDEYAQL